MSQLLKHHSEPIPGYKLKDRLGRGGYGEVWEVEAPGGIRKAIKFVYGDLEGAGDDAQAAEQEFKSLNRVKSIRHPYILSIERFDIVEGQLLIVMELADRSMWDRFNECLEQGLRGIPRDELLRYMDETAEALDLMNIHHQIQHMDIKPQNIFLVHQHVKVADFGLAKDLEGTRATVTGGVTPVYAPPETFEGSISRFSDQYSLAIVYQEMLTGVRPFSGSTTRQLLMQHLSAQPDVEVLKSPDREAVQRALSKIPDERFATCSDFVRALRSGNSGGHGNSFLGCQFQTPVTPVSIQTPSATPLPTPVMIGQNGLAITPITPILGASPISPGSDVTPRSTPKPSKGATTLPPLTVQRLDLGDRSSALRGLPSLVAPDPVAPAKVQNAPVTMQRLVVNETGRLSRMGIAPPEKLGPGVLFPTLFVGLGRTGLDVMRRLRTQMVERFGVKTLPHVRWLLIDTDTDTIHEAMGNSDVSFDSSEILHAKVNRPAHYLKRDSIPPLEKWMPADLIYRIPRNPSTVGVRSLGRLALLDHYHGITQRIRTHIESFLTEDNLNEADRKTKLGIRSNRPQVFLATSLSGATGSGMFLDLAYILRQEMRQMGYLRPNIMGSFILPHLDAESPRNLAVANSFAALRELEFCSRFGFRFETRYDTREPTLVDCDRPFVRCTVTTLPKGIDVQGVNNAIDHVASGLFEQTFSSLGRVMDDTRAQAYDGNHFALQTFGICRLIWPRNRFVQIAHRRLAQRLLRHWSNADVANFRNEVTEDLEQQWTSRQLNMEVFETNLEEFVTSEFKSSIELVFEDYLKQMVIHCGGAKPNPEAASDALEKLILLVGRPGKDESINQGTLRELLDARSKVLGNEADTRLAALAVSFIEEPRFRLAGAEEAIRQLGKRIEDCLSKIEREVSKLEFENEEDFANLKPKLVSLMSSGSSIHTSRRGGSSQLDEMVDGIYRWVKKRYRLLKYYGLAMIYRRLKGNVPEYLREVSFCRLQLSEFARPIDEEAKTWGLEVPGSDRPILPNGCNTLDEAAQKFVNLIPTHELEEFDKVLQQDIRKECRAVVTVCLNLNEQGIRFKEILLQHAEAFLQKRIKASTPSEIFFQYHPDAASATKEITQSFAAAKPNSFGLEQTQMLPMCIVGVPDNAAGARFRDIAKAGIPNLAQVEAKSAEEIVIYQENRFLPVAWLPHLGPVGQEAYSVIRRNEKFSTHTRNDIPWDNER